ncbi:unnamed protein product [Meganyctiphanes norvegica]|uniref:Uncharacterized protein n=1 Tax=Meganyctiphanes norvegica TaxID=48144 RepID=A0AAV2S6U3_MEGNR
MFDHCSYHLLDSLVPPSVDEDKANQDSLLSLQSICACAIVRNERNCQTLSVTPIHLHKIIWKSYLRDEYYAYKDSFDRYYEDNLSKVYPCKDSFNTFIPELLYHWPYKEFKLKEVMPKYPPRLSRFTSGLDDEDYDPMFQNNRHLSEFLNSISKKILSTFLVGFMDNLPEHEKQTCMLRKIDMSGFYIVDLCTTSDFVERQGHYKPYFKNNLERLEVIFDVSLPSDPISDIERFLDELACIYSNSSYPVDLKFSHVSMRDTDDQNGSCDQIHTKDVVNLIEKLVNNGTESIDLYTDSHTENGLEILKKVFENNSNQENISSIKIQTDAYSPVNSQVNFANYLTNLVHLDFSGNNMHGKLDFLLNMHRGLLFLNLRYCDLTNVDLVPLRESHHQLTLKELNLSHNELSYDDRCNLIMLCQHLSNVQTLDLIACELESWHCNEIKLLFDSFKIMPNIVNLNLDLNRFSFNTITVDIVVLHENPSLRWLELSLPAEYTNSDGNVNNQDDIYDIIRLFCFEMRANINKSRSQILYVDF